MKIIISGVVGVGKSTISQKLGQKYKWLVLSEPVESNPYLDDYYKDPKAMAFKMQIYMLMARSQQLVSSKKVENTIFDRSILEDIIFVNVLKKLNYINEIDYNVYFQFYHNVILSGLYLNDEIKPDLVVYLKVSTKTAIKRINLRGRKSEQEVEYKYWEILNEKYEQWYESNKTKHNFLVIDTENLNIDEIINIIDNAISNFKQKSK